MLKRYILQKIISEIDLEVCSLIVGTRQIGKTVLINQLIEALEQKGKEVHYFTLKNRETLKLLSSNPQNIAYLFPELNSKLYICIDDAQYLSNINELIHIVHEEYKDKIKLILCSNSSNPIPPHQSSIYPILPVSFEEFLILKNELKLLNEFQLWKKGKISVVIADVLLWKLIEEYIIYGGYPKVVLAKKVETKIGILEQIRDEYVKQDFLESGLKEEYKFFQTIQLLAEKTGSLMNINDLAKTVKSNHITIENFISRVQSSFYINTIFPFTNRLKKELTKMPKVYFNDTGLRNSFLNYFQPIQQRLDKTQLLENFIYTQLRNIYEEDEIYFWRTTDEQEVDFIIRTAYNSVGIEVKFNSSEIKQTKYKKFIQTYPEINLSYIHWDESLWKLI